VVPAVAAVVDPKRADELRVELAACDTPTTLNALWASMGPVYQPLLKEDFSARKAALK
jgi:hypothetical protein